MADFEKLLKKLQKKFDREVDDSRDEGYDDGWSEGYDTGHEVGHSVGFSEGVQAHKDHIQARLKASEQLSMSLGKGAEAVRMREMAEFLAFEYDPEEAERQAKIADENGF